MQVFDLDAEVFYGSTDWKPPTIEEAQELAGTQGEDQNEDPYTSPEELARITRILGFDPDELNDDWEEEAEEDVEDTKHLPGMHNQLSHGRGSMAADTGGNTSGGGGSDQIGTYSLDRSVEAVKERVHELKDRYNDVQARMRAVSEKRGRAGPDEMWDLATEYRKLLNEEELISFDRRVELEAQHAINLEEFLRESSQKRTLLQKRQEYSDEMLEKIREAGGDITGKWDHPSPYTHYKLREDGGDLDSVNDFQDSWRKGLYKINDEIEGAGHRVSAAYYGDPVEVKSTGKTMPATADIMENFPKIEQGFAFEEREFMAEAEIGIKTDERGMLGFLEDGQYKNHFHRGTAGVGRDGEGRLRGGYRRARKEGEEELFGIDQKAGPDDRPIYGFLENPARIKAAAAEIGYGDIQVVLKDELKGRTSYTVGDSLDTGVQEKPAVAVTAPIKYEGRDGTTTRVGLTTRDWVESGRGEFRPQYIEAQVHGGVSLKDVKVVRIPQDVANRMDRGTQIALQDSGVTIEIIPPRRDFISTVDERGD
jgi:hypothetical protein